MDIIKIEGGLQLKGSVAASGSKNSALPILFSTLLASGKHTFHNIPRVQDVLTALNIIESFGCSSQWIKENSLSISVPENLKSFKAHYNLMKTMRAGILCLGPLLARHKKAYVSLPGGCAIGSRPVNWHMNQLKNLGANLKISQGYIKGECQGPLVGAKISFKKPTVGGTQNLMMASSISKGKTHISGGAMEPEVLDLACYLKKMGAHIQITPSLKEIIIEGTSKLQPSTYKVIPDRIEVGTLLMAAAITKGEIQIEKCDPSHLVEVLDKLSSSGFHIKKGDDWIKLFSPSFFKATSISTAVFPGFPTDLQAQFMALMTQAQGQSTIEECIFENRFMHIPELLRLGARISKSHRKAFVDGPQKLQGADLTATDLRASSSLILAGLVAQGTTKIRRIYHLDRGYENLEKKLISLGANIKRVKDANF